MTKCKVRVLIALVTTLLLISVTQVGAGTMKYRVVLYHTKVEVMKIVNIEGHIVGIYESTGLATLDTGEVGVVSQKGTFDYIKGAGTHDGYSRLTLEDGSTIDIEFEGTTRPNPNGKGSLFESTSVVITQGGGRYTGIKGGGSYTGRRIVPAIGTGAALYTDMILRHNLP
jgi:hypothetical protein